MYISKSYIFLIIISLFTQNHELKWKLCHYNRRIWEDKTAYDKSLECFNAMEEEEEEAKEE